MTELDALMLRNIYTISESGTITGFASKSPVKPQELNCPCGAPFQTIRRYSILKQINQAPTVFDQLLARIGKTLNMFSKRVRYQERELERSFHSFRNQIRPNPLAANSNKALVSSRAYDLVLLSGSIQEYNTSTAMPFERSVSWLQDSLPGALTSLTKRTIHPTLSLRFTILEHRARNLWICDCLRVSEYLLGLDDPSLEVQRMGEVLQIQASKECWKGIAECEEAITKAAMAEAPAIEVEIRLQQIQLSHLLDIALAGESGVESPAPTMAPEAPSESLDKALQLCRRFPDTAGRFSGLVIGFGKGGNADRNKSKDIKATGGHLSGYALSNLPRTSNFESCQTELAWGEHGVGCLEICTRGGHPYSREMKGKLDGGEGCPECGREQVGEWEKVERMKEEGRRAGECLFEDRFLEAMRKGR